MKVEILICGILILISIENTITSFCNVAQTCETDLNETDCVNGALIANTNIFGCCPSCQPKNKLKEDTKNKKNNSCAYPSKCQDDGSYSPVQCKGDIFTGRCFCTNANGQRIFGQMWRSEAQDMKCTCSRRRAELEESGREDATLHCTGAGDFEPLQCAEGACWCAHPTTGRPLTPHLPEENVRALPCYNEAVIGVQYLRECESKVQAEARIRREHNEHGTVYKARQTQFCDYDGSYAPYQIKRNVAVCTDKDGASYGEWSTDVKEMGDMNCNCARDNKLYFPQKGETLILECDQKGNYRKKQTHSNEEYCVDSDGYQIACEEG